MLHADVVGFLGGLGCWCLGGDDSPSDGCMQCRVYGSDVEARPPHILTDNELQRRLFVVLLNPRFGSSAVHDGLRFALGMLVDSPAVISVQRVCHEECLGSQAPTTPAPDTPEPPSPPEDPPVDGSVPETPVPSLPPVVVEPASLASPLDIQVWIWGALGGAVVIAAIFGIICCLKQGTAESAPDNCTEKSAEGKGVENDNSHTDGDAESPDAAKKESKHSAAAPDDELVMSQRGDETASDHHNDETANHVPFTRVVSTATTEVAATPGGLSLHVQESNASAFTIQGMDAPVNDLDPNDEGKSVHLEAPSMQASRRTSERSSRKSSRLSRATSGDDDDDDDDDETSRQSSFNADSADDRSHRSHHSHKEKKRRKEKKEKKERRRHSRDAAVEGEGGAHEETPEEQRRREKKEKKEYKRKVESGEIDDPAAARKLEERRARKQARREAEEADPSKRELRKKEKKERKRSRSLSHEVTGGSAHTYSSAVDTTPTGTPADPVFDQESAGHPRKEKKEKKHKKHKHDKGDDEGDE